MFAHMGPAPFGRSGHTMVTVQNRILVVGGEAFAGDAYDEPTALNVLDTTKIKYPAKVERPPESTTKPLELPAQQAPPPAQQLDAAPPSMPTVAPLGVPAPAMQPANEAPAVQPANEAPAPAAGAGSLARAPSARVAAPEAESEADAAANRELWLSAMLSLAVKQGFVPPREDYLERLDTGPDGSERDGMVRTLLALKAQTTSLHAELGRQMRQDEERLAKQERARVAALQEAAYYRAKLLASESGQAEERGRLERQRIQQLEKLLSTTTREHGELERKVTMLVDQARLESRLRVLAEDRLGETTKRALAAEEAQLEVYKDYAALQKHSYETEALLRDHTAQISTLTSRLAAQQAERDSLEGRMSSSSRSADTNRTMLAQFQEALNAAHARTNEYERQRAEHQRQSDAQNATLLALRQEVQTKSAELELRGQQLEQQSAVVAELESIVANLQREAQAHRDAATGGLAQLLALQHAGAPGAASLRDAPQHTEHVQALQDEIQALRTLHEESRAAVNQMAQSLQQATERSNSLQHTNHRLFAEANAQRKQLTTALHELAMLRDASSTSRADDEHHARALEEAQVKLLALRQLLAEHEVDVPDEETLARPDFVHNRRVAELTREVEAHKLTAERNALDLQRAQDQMHRVGREWEARLREARVTEGAGSRAELDALRRRAEEAERRLQHAADAHEERVSQLENDYLTAVQFVRNTENMLRRLKEEHLKLRQDNAELRAGLGSRGHLGE